MDGRCSRRPPPPELCIICLEPLSERAIAVPCNHLSFDFICLVSWLQERAVCPLCKVDVTAVEYDYRSPEDFKVFFLPRHHPPPERNHLYRSGRNHYLPRRPRPVRRPSPPSDADSAILRRRHVYQRNLYSKHVGTNRISSYENLTPALIASSADLQSRARTFIRRELRAFPFLVDPSHGSASPSIPSATDARPPPPTSPTAEFLLSYALSILRTVDIKGASGAAEDMLADFLGRDNARLFWHEVSAWLRSPYSRLQDWDRAVQYGEPLPAALGSDRECASSDGIRERMERKSGDGRRRGEHSRHLGGRWRRGDPRGT